MILDAILVVFRYILYQYSKYSIVREPLLELGLTHSFDTPLINSYNASFLVNTFIVCDVSCNT